MAKLTRCLLLLFFLVAARLLGQPVGGDDFRQQDAGLDSREAVDGSAVGLQIHNTEPHADASTNETADIEFFFDTDLVGRISLIKIDDYDPGSGEDDSAMVFSTDRDGTLTEGMRLLSTGGIQFNGSSETLTDSGSQLSYSGNTLGIQGSTAALSFQNRLILRKASNVVSLSQDSDFTVTDILSGGNIFLTVGPTGTTATLKDTTTTTGDTLFRLDEGDATAGNLFEARSDAAALGLIFPNYKSIVVDSAGTFSGDGYGWGDNDTRCIETADDVLTCTTAGTANGFQLDATGDLTPIGTGTINANRYNGNVVIDGADLDTNVVFDDATNTYGAFAQDFSSASMTLPTSQTLTTPTISGTGFTNAQHAHLGATSGGQLTAPALPNSIRDMKASFNVPAPVTGDDGDFQVEFPAACTLIEVACNVQAATSVTINLYERARATPETGTTNMVTTSPVCVTGGDVETAFDDAALAANVPLALGISAVSGTPALLRVHVTCRRD